MKLICCSIYDKAVGAYMRPFFMQSEGQALRAFMDDLLSPDSVIAKHPEDYALFVVGKFFDNTGEVMPCEPRCIGRAHELVANRGRSSDDVEDRLGESGETGDERSEADAG
mgnify:CR=1 FL=1